MRSEDIKEIIEEKIKLFQKQGYNIGDYDIDKLVIGFLDIGDSLFPLDKELLHKREISSVLSIEKNEISSTWVCEMCEIIKEINEPTINKKITDKKIIELNTKIIETAKLIGKIIKDIPQYGKEYEIKDFHIIRKGIPFNEDLIQMERLITDILNNNYEIIIDYILVKDKNCEVIKYKLILLKYYKNISNFVKKSEKYIEKIYYKSNCNFTELKMIIGFMKIKNKLDKLNIKY